MDKDMSQAVEGDEDDFEYALEICKCCLSIYCSQMTA